MIITEQQSFCKSDFERTILAEACCYQSPEPFLFYKNKGIVSEWFLFLYNKECLPLVSVLDAEVCHTDCYLQVFLAIIHCIAGWKASFLLLSAYHSSICFYLLEITIWQTSALSPCLINSFNFVASENNEA